MTETRVTWNEEASGTYQRIAAIAVPRRAEQLAALLTLLPFGVEDAFRVVELGSGEGRLAAAILEAFPRARVTALDGSEAMRATTSARLEQFAGRFEVAGFDLLSEDWLHRLDGAHAVVSSLVVHHLDGPGKQALFAAIGGRLERPGALLIADIVLPGHPRSNELFAETYDHVARAQSLELTGSDAYFRDFLSEEWNIFRYPDDDWDKPSGVFEQLRWLDAAGFDAVECFWMQAGHAIYGGYIGAAGTGDGLAYERALEIATQAIA